MNPFKGLNPGELFDRLTIVSLKINFQDNGKIFLEELDDILSEINNKKYQVSMKLRLKLMLANLKIWELESDIRLGKENLLSLEEVGKRAIKIREYNNIRWKIKNKINKKYSYKPEIKHAWQKKLPKSVINEISIDIQDKYNIPIKMSKQTMNIFIDKILGVDNGK